MYELSYTTRFLSAAKRCKKQGKDMGLLWEAVRLLMEEGRLPVSYCPHLLHEEYAGYWDATLRMIGCLSGNRMTRN